MSKRKPQNLGLARNIAKNLVLKTDKGSTSNFYNISARTEI